MESWICLVLGAVVFVSLHGVVDARVPSRSQYTPACYRNFRTWDRSGQPCKHPSYTSCVRSDSEHLCCGPDHYCCTTTNDAGTAYTRFGCCRKDSNLYEIFAIICGALGWLALFTVVSICVVGNIQKLCKRKKVFPFSDEDIKHGQE